MPAHRLLLTLPAAIAGITLLTQPATATPPAATSPAPGASPAPATSPATGTSPMPATNLAPGTSPTAGTSPAPATSPTAGTSPVAGPAAPAAVKAAGTAALPLTASAAGPAALPPPKPGNQLFIYDQKAVPLGATAQVEFNSTGRNLWIRLDMTGLLPRRAYGAHLHTAECGTDPKAAGPHFQHRLDPAATREKPSADPAYANPANEVWLDFTANARGVATVRREQHWMFSADRMPKSLVVHTGMTMTAPGVAGTAGARVACLNLKFRLPKGH